MLHDPENHEGFLRLLAVEENRIRAFARHLLPNWAAVDDVLQESYLVAWKKYSDFTGGDFFRWMCVIVRFESLKYGRRHVRSKLVFDEDVVLLLAETPSLCTSGNMYSQRLEALQACLKSLGPAQRELVLSFYADGTSTRQIAERLKRTRSSVYKAVRRIRSALAACVEKKMSLTHG